MRSFGCALHCVLIFLVVAGIGARPAVAALIWTGGGDGVSIYQEANWEDTETGLAPPEGTVDGKVSINKDLIVNGGTPGGPGGASAHLQLGETGSLTISDGVFRMGKSAAAGIRMDDAVGGDRVPIAMTGGELLTQFLSDIELSMSGPSIATFYGGGNPLNNSRVALSGCDVVLNFLAETVETFTTEHLGKITVDAAAAVIGTNLAVISDGASGSIVTVIPEPVSIVLLSLGGLFCRRRR